MPADLKEQIETLDWPPPVDADTIRSLEAAGIKVASEPWPTVATWRPVRQRPAWLAFLRRLLRLRP